MLCLGVGGQCWVVGRSKDLGLLECLLVEECVTLGLIMTTVVRIRWARGPDREPSES